MKYAAQTAAVTNHSAKNAVLWALDDILNALDPVDLATLTSLDLSAVFSNVDYKMLISHHKISYSIGGTVLGWFSTYLEQQLQ